jgi:glycerol uptake facilitator-like aquaporin
VTNVFAQALEAEGAGWMVIASGWAFAVMAGVFASSHSAVVMRTSILR